MNTGFTLTAPAANPSGGVFSFGAPASSTSTTPFGTLGSSSTSTTSMFGAATSNTGSSLFPSSSATLTLAPIPTATSSSLSMFPSLGQATTTSTPSTGFSLGTGIGFPNPASTTSLFGVGTGLGAQAAAAATAPTTSASIGLGGVDTSQLSGGLNGGNAAGKKDSKAVKEAQLPQEIAVTLESFKKYVKDQKSVREEMSRVSPKNIIRVQEQTINLKQVLSVISNGLQRNALAIDKLKQESAQELRNAEIAQRTKETPPTLQYEHTAPSEFFHNSSVNFEYQMQQYRRQIELLERHLLSLSQPAVLTPDELTVIMRRLHDTFVALAAQLQTVHQAVQLQKEQFRNYVRLVHGDATASFHPRKDGSKELFHDGKIAVTIGPAPFSCMPSAAAVAMASALSRTEQPGSASSINAIGGSTGIGSGLSSGGLLSNTSSNLGSSFGLQSMSLFKPLGK